MGQVKGFFDPTHHGRLKKIQLNSTHHRGPTQPTWIGLGWVEPMGLTVFYFYINIIIKLSRIYIYIYISNLPPKLMSKYT